MGPSWIFSRILDGITTVTITGALGAVSQSDSTATVNNVEPGITINNAALAAISLYRIMIK